MLKMYHQNPRSGDTPDYWANSWDDINFEAALRLCEKDPLVPLFNRYLKPEALILEGGCGKGHWVAYFADRGYRIVGLDFARRTLAELNGNHKGLSLCGGNVNALPFEDETFDIYYSGGVVEHFEAGCDKAIAEARRVLKTDGVLLISVPYYSPLRRVLTPFRRGEWQKLSGPETRTKVPQGLTYFQYAYRASEFEAMLARFGLETIEKMGYSVMWGLYDLKFLSRRADKKNQTLRDGKAPADFSGIADATSNNFSPRTFVKKLLIGEESSNVVNSVTTRFMRWSSANMMMFVCRRK